MSGLALGIALAVLGFLLPLVFIFIPNFDVNVFAGLYTVSSLLTLVGTILVIVSSIVRIVRWAGRRRASARPTV